MLTHIRLRIPTEKQKCLILGGNMRKGMGHSMEEEENGHQMWPCLLHIANRRVWEGKII